MITWFRSSLALALLVAVAAPAAAQDLTELENGDRVESAELTPAGPFSLGMEDTVTVNIAFRDAEGEVVTGIQWGFQFSPDIAGSEPVGSPEDGAFRIWGRKPGKTSLQIGVLASDDDGNPAPKLVDAVDVTIEDWPVSRIEIDEPAYALLAGTSFPLNAVAITTEETVHNSAELTWGSSNQDVAIVTTGGVVTLLQPGEATITVSAGGVTADRTLEVLENPVREVRLTPGSASARTGDVIYFDIAALDESGQPVSDAAISLAVQAMPAGETITATMYEDGAFVAEDAGVYRVFASAGAPSASAVVDVVARPAPTEVKLLGRSTLLGQATTDLWVFTGKDGRDYVYTGTMPQAGGERMYAWDVTDPTNVVLTDSIFIDARRVNDVKVNEDASWAIVTREQNSVRGNGIVVLDLADPARPTVLSELTENLTAGIHNVWINGDVVYAVNNGTNALHIIDMTDPANPVHLGQWEVRPGEEDKSLHDVWAEDGLAYLSYWDDGLVILDVGAGIKGGTPRQPQFVSQYSYRVNHGEEYGNTHAAFRYRDYVFVGDEIFGCSACVNGPRGYIHVIDVSDIENPHEVAKYEVPEAGAHNIWVEDDVMYVAHYQAGLRIVDVSGELRGDLYRQGREIGWYHTAGDEEDSFIPNEPSAWGPQPFKGNVFVSDYNSGVWVLQHERPEPPVP